MPDGPTALVGSIHPAAPDQRRTALAILFQNLPADQCAAQAESVVASAAAGQFSLDGLFVATEAGAIVGAVLAEVQAGRTASIWPPRGVGSRDDALAPRLLHRAEVHAIEHGVQLLQALTPGNAAAEAQRDAAALLAAGYHQVAELLYLVSLASDFPTAEPADHLAFELASSENESRLARIIERTYERTLDCPQLNGQRTIADVLAGYRSAGDPRGAEWWIVRHDERDVGCLLLADHPAVSQREIVYMGLAPEARGRGWGVDITRHAQWLTRRTPRQRLVLAVDADNAPAVAMYAAAGFSEWDRRVVFVKALKSADA